MRSLMFLKPAHAMGLDGLVVVMTGLTGSLTPMQACEPLQRWQQVLG